MKKLTTLILSLFLIGCPPAEHKHPEMTNEPKVNEIQNTHSGVVWRIIHDPEGRKMYVTQTSSGWLVKPYSGSMLYVSDPTHEWLNKFDLSGGSFDFDGKWIPNDNLKLKSEGKELRAKIADLESQNANLQSSTLKALERSKALESKTPHRDYSIVKELNERLKKKNQALEDIVARMSLKPEKTEYGCSHFPNDHPPKPERVGGD